MYNIEILPLAKKDIKENAIWYNKQLKGLGLRFTKAIRNELKFIQKNPFATVNRYRNVHTCTVFKFPFLIHYTIQEEQNKITVIGVFKYQQSPSNWDNR
jgi:mRNA-degrading endonuclease RelE of RelBE toxin-antitoxin system